MKLALLFTLMLATTPALADTAHCAALHARAPQQIVGLAQIASEAYEPEHPGLGYGARYRTADDTLSVFYYDAGFAQIGPEHVEANFYGAMNDLTSVLGQQGMTLGQMQHYSVSQPGFFLNHLALGQDSTGRMQAVALGQDGDCIIKLRVTAGSVRADQALQFFEAIAFQVDESFR